MYKAEWESARPVLRQGGGFFLTPGCPVSSGTGAHAGQGLGKWPLQTLQASWASGRPRRAHPHPPTFRGGASRTLREVSAAMLTGGRGRAARGRGTLGPRDRGPLPSLPLRPSLWGPLGSSGGLLLEEGEPGYRPQIGGRMQAVHQLPWPPGIELWFLSGVSWFLHLVTFPVFLFFFLSHFFFLKFFKPYLFRVPK